MSYAVTLREKARTTAAKLPWGAPANEAVEAGSEKSRWTPTRRKITREEKKQQREKKHEVKRRRKAERGREETENQQVGVEGLRGGNMKKKQATWHGRCACSSSKAGRGLAHGEREDDRVGKCKEAKEDQGVIAEVKKVDPALEASLQQSVQVDEEAAD